MTAASAAIIIGLVASDSAQYIPFVLGFDALVTVGLGTAVIVIAWKDPSRLMLGQITATEYAKIRRLHLGDDQQGEHAAQVIGTTLLENEKTAAEEESQTRELALPPTGGSGQIEGDRDG